MKTFPACVEYGDRGQNENRAAQAGRRFCPDSGHHRKQQHGGVTDEESGTYHPLQPWEAATILPGEGRIIHGEIAQKQDEQSARQPRAPAPETGDQNQYAGESFGDAEPDCRR